MEESLKQMRRQMRANLKKAFKGWRQWYKLVRLQGVAGHTLFLLLPGDDAEVAYYALKHLDNVLDNRQMVNAVVLAHDPVVLKAAPLFSKRILHAVPFSREQAEQLMQYHTVYNVDARLVVMSLDEPYGRNARTLVGRRGVTLEEVVVVGVYRMFLPVITRRPEYKGTDPEILAFLRAGGEGEDDAKD